MVEPGTLLRKTFESLDDAVFIIDAQRRVIVDCNPAVEGMFGYRPEELRGGSTERLHISREKYLQFGRESEEVLGAGKAYSCCFVMRRKDGTTFSSEHTVTGIRDERGQRIAAVSVVRDLTPERLVERTLQLSEARFYALFENAAVGMVMVAVSGRILRANPAFCAMLGFSEEDLKGKTILEITYPEDIPLSKTKFEFEKHCPPRVVQLSKRYLRSDGCFIWSRVTAKWICDTEENPLFCVTVVQDLTREKRIEEKLRISEQKLRRFVGGLDELVFEFDEQGTYLNVWTNDESLLLRTRLELMGRRVDEILDKPLAQTMQAAFRRVLRSEQGESLEYSLQIGGEKRWFLARIAPIPSFDGGPRTVSFLARDITRRKQMEERQRNIEEVLRRSDQLKSELISTAAHELRTPLTAIQGFAELLTEGEFGTFDPQMQKEFLLEIRHKSEALNKIIDVMVDMNRVESGRPIALDRQLRHPEEILRRAVRAFSLKFPERRFEGQEIEALASPIPVDAERLEQVLDNILSNAVKYSPSDQPITISSCARNDVYLVRIEDRGKGMTPEEVGQVFEKFFRADTSNTALGGLGLGMSITRGIIEAHGGEIWLESEPGRGTKVSFTLPLNGD